MVDVIALLYIIDTISGLMIQYESILTFMLFSLGVTLQYVRYTRNASVYKMVMQIVHSEPVIIIIQ